MAALFFVIGAVIVTIIASLIFARVPGRSGAVTRSDAAGVDGVDGGEDEAEVEAETEAEEADVADDDDADELRADDLARDDLARDEADAQVSADAEAGRAAAPDSRRRNSPHSPL
ncbi:hypothetical protein GCM10025867_44820 [Frondihabitans sucicola]|uniref:Uncharacterized protein n=1 Tax=Frondihabitans sucicola TaxID=1268041 RepID=A0ABM8GHD3_9MICO|nr:hypothetical protein [Frondihabitans sucicola]BDZ47767.1 hypothetical protein GCM10025867_00080 [Frondihabitans sucicola]BDZ52241.1 hypothetical protein GCM10025867_44820 [Frondihabitans sucicola]